MSVPGFRVPLHNSLTQPILMMGVPRTFAIVNGTVAAAILFGLHNPWLLPVNFLVHLVAVTVSRDDPQLLAIVFRQLKFRTYYRV